MNTAAETHLRYSVDLLRKPLNPSLKFIKNCHFPGLYSIALEESGGNLTRAFVARPGELHPDLQNPDSFFLWHSHAYNFIEIPVVGTVENIKARFVGTSRLYADEQEFNAYGFSSGILGQIALDWYGVFCFDVQPCITYEPGELFYMESHEIHRVVFKPDTETGWFCAIIEELAQFSRPTSVYIPKGLDKPQYLDKLYVNIEREEAAIVIADFLEANKATMPG